MDIVINRYKNIINFLERIKSYDCFLNEEDSERLFNFDMTKEYKCSNVTVSTGFTILHKLVMMTHKYPNLNNFLRDYLKEYTDIDGVNKNGWTALILAARNSNIYSSDETVRILVDAGANLDLQTNNGTTALCMAAKYARKESSYETVRILVDAGANLDLQTNNGFAPLHCSTTASGTTSTLETVKILVDAGAKINLKNKKNMTALHLCALCSFDVIEETIKVFIDAGASLDEKDFTGSTPLHLVAKYLSTLQTSHYTANIFKMLIDAGANNEIIDNNNKKAHDYLPTEIKLILTCDKPVGECIICYGELEGLSCTFQHHTCADCLLKSKAQNCVMCNNKLIFT